MDALVDRFLALANSAADNNPHTVARLLEDALRIEMPRFIAAKYLTPYGIDMPAFLKSKDAFTEERWNELSRDMLQYSNYYDPELIVSGWGEAQAKLPPKRSEAYIYSVSRDGVSPPQAEGFYACGSGQSAAHSVLSYLNCDRHMPTAEVLYCVASAKFMAEKSSGVGPNTLITVHRRLAEHYTVQFSEIEELRTVWEKYNSPSIPEEAEDIAVQVISKHQKTQEVSLRHMARKLDTAIQPPPGDR